jgi:hypothetical protein
MTWKTKGRAAAMKLLKDPQLLFHVGVKIGELGVVGEELNRRILFLAGLTSAFPRPVSLIIKGRTSSGKSNLIGSSVKLFPPELVIVRASLSKQAPLHAKDSLKGKLFYLLEYRGGREAQYLLRLQQSEGDIAHEYTTVTGSRRGTDVAHRMGSPVILTSTTANQIFADDDTRFAGVWADESPAQTLAILQAAIRGGQRHREPGLTTWRQAIRLLLKNPPTYAFPDWFETIATKLPVQQVRVRRDWVRFLTLCRAIALSRRFMSPSKQRELITFADYCVAYRLLNPAFSSTVHGVHEREIAVAECVKKIHARLERAASVAEVADELGWKESLVYKFVKPAVDHNLVRYESGTWPKNVKRLLPVPGAEPGFLPSPRSVFDQHEELGPSAQYVDPISGKTKILRRRTSASAQKGLAK